MIMRQPRPLPHFLLSTITAKIKVNTLPANMKFMLKYMKKKFKVKSCKNEEDLSPHITFMF